MAKNDVVVKITQKQVAGSTGFGVPLIVQGMAAAAKEYAEYGDLEEISAAGYETTSAVYKQCEKMFMQNSRPGKVALCAGTGKVTDTLKLLKDKDFRQIIPVFGETDDKIQDVAAYVETTDDKLLFVRVSDTDTLTGIGEMDRTVVIVYPGENIGAEGAFVGATAGLTIGSFTYKNIIIKGVAADPLTDSQIEAIHTAGGICIVRKAGDTVTSEGTAMSGEYIDIIDSKDYIIKNIAYKSQKLLNSTPKLSFDNVGISQLEGVVTNVLSEAFGMGMIAVDEDGVPLYSTNFATRAETSEGDRAQRKYNGGKFSFNLAGAIHYAVINGTVEV